MLRTATWCSLRKMTENVKFIWMGRIRKRFKILMPFENSELPQMKSELKQVFRQSKEGFQK